MAHNLNEKNGKISAVFATGKNGLPWHQLGQMVENAMTWQDAYKLAQLDWEVKKQDMFFKNELWVPGSDEPKGWQVPNKFAICRSDIQGSNSVIGTVGNTYEPTQNFEIGGWIDNVLEQIDGAHYEAAGALGKGERVWALARVPFDASIGEDKHQTFLLFMSSHDGSMSNTIMMTDVRVVCQNTLNFALSNNTNKAIIKVRHTKSAKEKLTKITEEIQTGLKQDVKSLKDKFEKILNWKTTPEGILNIFNKMFGEDWIASKKKQTKVAKIAKLFNSNDNNAIPEQASTGMAILNAVTNYVDHEKPSRVTSTSGYSTSEQARADSAMVGIGSLLKKDTLEYILTEVETSTTSTNPNPSIQMDVEKKGALDNIANMMQL